MEDKIKECKNLSVDDCCMELDPCGLTPCQHIKDCYYKQLLVEQAKNSELELIINLQFPSLITNNLRIKSWLRRWNGWKSYYKKITMIKKIK